ncbi:MAG: ChaB family protein [Stellaceae bacterium]
MPYQSLDEMPPAIRSLPRHAQEIFRAAFNAAWQSYADQGPQAQEETAFRVAWAAVKKRYRKVGDVWVER